MDKKVKKEFNLSKRRKCSCCGDLEKCKYGEADYIYPEEDVKEFIKRLKEYIDDRAKQEKGGWKIRVLELRRKINSLAGDDLK